LKIVTVPGEPTLNRPSSTTSPFQSSDPNSPLLRKKCACLLGTAPRQGIAGSRSWSGLVTPGDEAVAGDCFGDERL
jgi:hypothetical protein